MLCYFSSEMWNMVHQERARNVPFSGHPLSWWAWGVGRGGCR